MIELFCRRSWFFSVSILAFVCLWLLSGGIARAQQYSGVSVNGTCEAGSCTPALLPVGGSFFSPFSFTVTTSSGDTYRFSGQISASDGNGGSYLPGGASFVLTYLGNSAGGASRGASFATHLFWSYVSTNQFFNLGAGLSGSFSPGIAASTSVTGVTLYSGAASETFGPFAPPNAFNQSDTVGVTLSGSLTVDEGVTVAFGAGSPAGSYVAIGGGVPDALVAAILPGGRSVDLSNPATVFATLLNTSNTNLSNCQVSLPASAPSGLSMSYQTTDPATNTLIGTINTPVAINANGSQTFLLDFTSTSARTMSALPLLFDCGGTNPADSITGVNTIDLLFSATPIADVIALAATASGDGTVHIAQGAGAFAVASANVGASGSLTVTADTGGASLPVALSLCQTGANGQCIGAASSSVPVTIAGGATPTFSIFAGSNGSIPFAPGSSRIFVRFTDSSGASHGSTSVAVTTD